MSEYLGVLFGVIVPGTTKEEATTFSIDQGGSQDDDIHRLPTAVMSCVGGT